MTNKKICDKCQNTIPSGVDYIKLQKIIHKDKITYEGVGHLCESCFDAIIAGITL